MRRPMPWLMVILCAPICSCVGAIMIYSFYQQLDDNDWARDLTVEATARVTAAVPAGDGKTQIEYVYMVGHERMTGTALVSAEQVRPVGQTLPIMRGATDPSRSLPTGTTLESPVPTFAFVLATLILLAGPALVVMRTRQDNLG